MLNEMMYIQIHRDREKERVIHNEIERGERDRERERKKEERERMEEYKIE